MHLGVGGGGGRGRGLMSVTLGIVSVVKNRKLLSLQLRK